MFSVSEKQQVCQLFFVQVLLIVLMGALMTYGPEADANLPKNHTGLYVPREGMYDGATYHHVQRRYYIVAKLRRHRENYTVVIVC